MNPWPFQKEVVQRTKKALHSGFKAPCIVMPTGSGKTVVASTIIHSIMKQLGTDTGGRFLFLVHREELVHQTIATLKEIECEEHAGIIQSGVAGSPWAPIQVAMVQTLTKRLHKVDWLRPRVIFVDEAHHATAGTWRKIIQKWPKAFVIGMTATPARTDDKGLGFIFDKLIIGPGIQDLTPEYLAPVKLLAVDIDFISQASSLKMQSEHGRSGPVLAKVVETWLRHAKDKKTIFFGSDVEHSKAINEELLSHGIKSVHLDGDTNKQERRSKLEAVKRGDYQCVCNCRLFTEGTDWKEAECVVLATKTQSLTLYKQMIGRAMRRGVDKQAVVIDCGGNWYFLGLPDEDIEWSLEKGVLKDQVKSAASKVVQCESCGFVYSKTEDSCPLCAHVNTKPMPLEVDANVKEIKSEHQKPTKKKISSEIIATGGDIEKLKEIQKKYGYGHGWAWKMHKVYKFAWSKER
ncbi:MAG: DEAD/DEAH box helicase [Gammaproteobacteria bacterium]|nr:DEAD/DEAH box helicase [Gammaproteobacteria bacterium]